MPFYPFSSLKKENISLKPGYIYYVSPNKNRSVLEGASLDPILIDKLSHFWLIVEVENNIKAFILTSQFFKSIFKDEIGSILDFHNEKCSAINCGHLNKFKSKNSAFNNIVKKYDKEKFSISRKYIYLIDKHDYGLDLESIINIEKLFEFGYDLFNSYYEKGYITFKEVVEFNIRDKFLISSQIKANLESDKNDGIQRLENEPLGKLYKQWIKVYK